jgi:UDP-N-acetylmuramyl pentapeptide synthase
MKLPLSRIAEFISAAGEFPKDEIARAYSIDSRTVRPGELFFAVKGERFDGHDFVASALENRAVAAVVIPIASPTRSDFCLSTTPLSPCKLSLPPCAKFGPSH